jgi:hypothetical protein
MTCSRTSPAREIAVIGAAVRPAEPPGCISTDGQQSVSQACFPQVPDSL